MRPANFRLPGWHCSTSRWERTRWCWRRRGRRSLGALFADAECCDSICRIVALVGAAATGLFQTPLGDQAVCDKYLVVTIRSTPLLLACVYICHCAFYYSPIPGAAKVKKCVKKTALPKALREA